jgi:hypothetical protein
VPDNSDSPFFQVAKSIGDKRALVSEKSFGKPFAKVTLLNCGEVASTKPGEEVKSEDGAGEEQSSQYLSSSKHTLVSICMRYTIYLLNYELNKLANFTKRLEDGTFPAFFVVSASA